MKLRIALTATMLAALAACGGTGASNGSASSDDEGSPTGSGVTIPAQFVGTWGADCASPFVRFNADGTIHVYPDKADYTLKAAALEGADLKVTYPSSNGEMTDVYASEGETLRLTKTIAGGQEATWDKRPMNKCS
jgi:hypothetical protein